MCGRVRTSKLCMDKLCCMHVCMYVWMYGWTDGWIDGWMDGWMDAWMDGWMDGCVKNTIVLISTISIVYMATMHSTICALDQGLEPKTIARGKTIQRIVHKTRTIGQEDKRETTWTQSITNRVPVKLYMVAEQGSWQRQSR